MDASLRSLLQQRAGISLPEFAPAKGPPKCLKETRFVIYRGPSRIVELVLLSLVWLHLFFNRRALHGKTCDSIIPAFEVVGRHLYSLICARCSMKTFQMNGSQRGSRPTITHMSNVVNTMCGTHPPVVSVSVFSLQITSHLTDVLEICTRHQ